MRTRVAVATLAEAILNVDLTPQVPTLARTVTPLLQPTRARTVTPLLQPTRAHTVTPQSTTLFMSAHSKTPYITPIMDFPSGKGVVWGAQGAAARIFLE